MTEGNCNEDYDVDIDTIENDAIGDMTISAKRRETLSKEKIREFVRLYQLNYKNKEIQTALNLSKNCVITLGRRYRLGEFANIDEFKTAAEKKKCSKKDYSAERDIIARALSVNNSLTQKEICEELRRNGIKLSLPKVCRILKAMVYSRKRLVVVPVERNSERIIEQRTEFCRYIDNISDDSLVYLDEFGVNRHCVRSYGYSPKNSKAVSILHANRGRNVSVLVAISKNGILCYEVCKTPFNSEKFKEFLLQKLLPGLKNKNPVLVMDNCRIHKTADVIRTITAAGVSYKFLPAYSPQLNPIEEMFSSIKSRYKSANSIPGGVNNIVTEITRIIDEYDLSGNEFYRHMREWVTMGLAGHVFL